MMNLAMRSHCAFPGTATIKHRSNRATLLASRPKLGTGAAYSKGRVRTFQARAEILWSLQPTEEWASKAQPFVDQKYPLSLTEVIDKKRPGPNKTGCVLIGAVAGGADLVIDLPTVSSKHCEVEEDGDTGDLFVTDLNSLNGTFVNGEKIVGKVKINPGDTLSFGGEPVFAVMRSALAHA